MSMLPYLLAMLSIFIQISHVSHIQSQCDINDNNDLIYGMCSSNETQNAQQRVTFNNVSLFYNSFYQLLTSTNNNSNTDTVANNDSNINASTAKELKNPKTTSFNFAAFDSGATVLSAAEGITSAKSILLNRKDKYMMMPCDLKQKWFIIQLSEDIVIDQIMLMNWEHYSSNFKDIRIYARNDNHNNDDNDINAQHNWFFIADFKLENKNTNTIVFEDNHWLRSLKIVILSFYGNEYYCTVTQIKVFGSTMLPHWRDELLSHLDAVDQIKQNITNNATKNTANITKTKTQITINKHTKDKEETKTRKTTNNKQQSVFTILTKRITSLELNLTKQQMEVTRLVHLFNEIKDLDQRFDEFQINLTNHMLFQSYGISMMLKTFKDNHDINMDNNKGKKENGTDRMNEDDSFTMYPDWSSQKSYYNDMLSWERHERLERIESYMENVLFMITSLYWIGLLIIVSHVIMAICIVVYVFKCCRGMRHKKHERRLASTKHRITPSSNTSLRKKFALSRTLSSRSESSSKLMKRKNRKKIKK